MSSNCGNGSSKRKRVSGLFSLGVRGQSILTDACDIWVIDCEAVPPAYWGDE